jgi:hypothetical protein
MRKSNRSAIVAVLGCGVASVVVTVGSAGNTASKQRIAITESASVDSGGSFELLPLTKGSLKHDSGTAALTATVGAPVIRAGLQVTPVAAVTTVKSKLGTFKLVQKIDSVDVSGGYSSDRGTWSLSGGTGAYAGLTGSGKLAAVGIPGGDGNNLIRHEGFVGKGQP